MKVFLLINCTKGKLNTAKKAQLASNKETKLRCNPNFPTLKITYVYNKFAIKQPIEIEIVLYLKLLNLNKAL